MEHGLSATHNPYSKHHIVLSRNLTTLESAHNAEAFLLLEATPKGIINAAYKSTNYNIEEILHSEGDILQALKKQKPQWKNSYPPAFYPFDTYQNCLVGDHALESFLNSLPPLSHGQRAFVDSAVGAFTSIRDMVEDIPTTQQMTPLGVKLWAEIWARIFPVAAEINQGRDPEVAFRDGFYRLYFYLNDGEQIFRGTWKELILKIFGVYRKPLTRVISSLKIEQVNAIYQMREIFNADEWERAFREGNPSSIAEKCDNASLEVFGLGEEADLSLLRSLSYKSRLDILMSSSRFLGDSLLMLDELASPFTQRVHSSEELHDALMSLPLSFWKEQKDSTVALPEDIGVRSVCHIGNSVEVAPLLSQKAFVELGSELNICIGRPHYLKRSLAGKSFCFSFSRNGKNFAALEIKPDGGNKYKVSQFYGENNCQVEGEAQLLEAFASFVPLRLSVGEKPLVVDLEFLVN